MIDASAARLVEVAFVAVKLVMVAIVAESELKMPFVKFPMTAKRFVLVAFVVDALSAKIFVDVAFVVVALVVEAFVTESVAVLVANVNDEVPAKRPASLYWTCP